MATNNALNTFITGFNSDSNLAGASNTQGVTTLAAKSYIDNKFANGNILQVESLVRTDGLSTSGQIPADNTIPQQSEGAQFFNKGIFPQSADSVFYVEVFLFLISVSTGGSIGFVGALFKDELADAIAASYGSIWSTQYLLRAIVPSVSLDEVRFKFRFGRAITSGTAYANRGETLANPYSTAGQGYIRIMEVLYD